MLFLQDDHLYYPDGLEQTTIKAFRAYFPLSGIHGAATGNGDIKAFVLNFGDESTVVEMINGEMVNGKSDGWYDVSGRKLNKKPAQRGIYIYNGLRFLSTKNKAGGHDNEKDIYKSQGEGDDPLDRCGYLQYRNGYEQQRLRRP